MVSLVSEVNKIKVMNFFQNTLGSNIFRDLIYRILIVPSEEIALHKLKKIMQNSPKKDIKKSGKKIVFNSVDAKYTKITYTSIGLAKALQLRGNDVKMILCDRALKSCAGHFTIDKPPSTWECKNCKFFSEKIYKNINLPYATYNEYIRQDELSTIEKSVLNLSDEECKNFIYKNVKVGEHARTSADRYFKGGLPLEELYDKILRMELNNAIISTEIAEKIFTKERPDVIVSSHTCYSSWGSFSEYFLKKSIRVVSWGEAENMLTFDEEKIKDNFNKFSETYRKKSFLDEKENKELDTFLNKRFKGEEGQVSLYGFSAKKEEEIKKLFQFDKYKKTCIIFPNVPWDASLLNADKAFKDVYDWISYTIELFRDKPKQQLIIKIHPSEIRLMGSKKTVLDYINEAFPTLPSNIYIIPPITDISPYSLFPYIGIGIVYNGTLGLELAINKIPVVVAGIAHYIGKGFTLDATSKEEYKKMLFEKTKKPTKDNVEQARVYAYYYFLKRAIPLQFVYYNSFLNLGLKIKSLKEFEEGQNKYIDLICNYIVNDGVYQDWEIKKNNKT